jgi:NAD/NADP transhydrogenase alpha subunit
MRASRAQIGLHYWAIWWATALIQERSLNVVGGFTVTDRMLEMFKAKPEEKKKDAEEVPS